MHAFAALLDRLVLTPQRNGKIRLLVDYFKETPDPDRGYALGAITRDLDLPSVKPAMIRGLIQERMDPVLFAYSYDYVGDLAETVSLAWPHRPGANRAPEISEVVETLLRVSRREGPQRVAAWLDALDASGRYALLKLVTGGLRIGVSGRLAKQALADFGSIDVNAIEEIWHGLEPPYVSLFDWLEGRADRPESALAVPFRPVMLAHPLIEKSERDQETPDALTNILPDAFAAEWKWDGIRIQAAVSGDERRLYTRTGDDISHTFPDVLDALDFEGAIDGELLVMKPDSQFEIAPFSDLQQRLNRKTVSAKTLREFPAFVRAYDVLNDRGEDVRALTFKERRTRLEALVGASQSPRLDLSPLVEFDNPTHLADLRENPPHPAIEGLMLKRWVSVYEPGRPKGPWFKWKRDPYLIDVVLLYAQRGHGKRSSFYSDYTFGVWNDEGALVPVGKAYFGFTDEELKEIDRFVRNHTIDRFGPVRAVTAEPKTGLVLEVAFEGLNRSTRHKSGIAMRFPRINRLRWDKPPAEADRIDTLLEMLP
ncbi:MAG: cisplatin damage response ATP-dependent DNA ligase [Pseudomonadota bacterium]